MELFGCDVNWLPVEFLNGFSLSLPLCIYTETRPSFLCIRLCRIHSLSPREIYCVELSYHRPLIRRPKLPQRFGWRISKPHREVTISRTNHILTLFAPALLAVEREDEFHTSNPRHPLRLS